MTPMSATESQLLADFALAGTAGQATIGRRSVLAAIQG
jgi:hypothetical protein